MIALTALFIGGVVVCCLIVEAVDWYIDKWEEREWRD